MDGTVMVTKYPKRNSSREDSYQDGLKFQDFVVENLTKLYGVHIQTYSSRAYQFSKGESVQNAEIKLDERYTDTKRLSIEIAEKKSGKHSKWYVSGIYRDSRFYIQGNCKGIYLFQTKFLRQLHKTGRYKEDEWPKEYPTVKKFYLPIKDANRYGEYFSFEKVKHSE